MIVSELDLNFLVERELGLGRALERIALASRELIESAALRGELLALVGLGDVAERGLVGHVLEAHRVERVLVLVLERIVKRRFPFVGVDVERERDCVESLVARAVVVFHIVEFDFNGRVRFCVILFEKNLRIKKKLWEVVFALKYNLRIRLCR